MSPAQLLERPRSQMFSRGCLSLSQFLKHLADDQDSTQSTSPLRLLVKLILYIGMGYTGGRGPIFPRTKKKKKYNNITEERLRVQGELVREHIIDKNKFTIN